jgi:hypothetical protein
LSSGFVLSLRHKVAMPVSASKEIRPPTALSG